MKTKKLPVSISYGGFKAKTEEFLIPLLKKDSLDITEEDRKKIHEACQKADSDKIVVTHGTDTIIETAQIK